MWSGFGEDGLLGRRLPPALCPHMEETELMNPPDPFHKARTPFMSFYPYDLTVSEKL